MLPQVSKKKAAELMLDQLRQVWQVHCRQSTSTTILSTVENNSDLNPMVSFQCTHLLILGLKEDNVFTLVPPPAASCGELQQHGEGQEDSAKEKQEQEPYQGRGAPVK